MPGPRGSCGACSWFWRGLGSLCAVRHPGVISQDFFSLFLFPQALVLVPQEQVTLMRVAGLGTDTSGGALNPPASRAAVVETEGDVGHVTPERRLLVAQGLSRVPLPRL